MGVVKEPIHYPPMGSISLLVQLPIELVRLYVNIALIRYICVTRK